MTAVATNTNAYWMPFTANRDFKKAPRVITGASESMPARTPPIAGIRSRTVTATPLAIQDACFAWRSTACGSVIPSFRSNRCGSAGARLGAWPHRS